MVGMSMFPVWSYLSYFCYNLDREIKSKMSPEAAEKISRGWIYTNVERLRKGVAVGFFIFGACLSGYWMSRTMNTVRRLILRKGGKHVTVITYGLFGANSRMITVPITHVSGVRRNF